MVRIIKQGWCALLLAGCLFHIARPVKAHPEILFTMAAPRPALQTANPAIQRLRIQIMPEYDDPRILIIVQGRLHSSSASFPRLLTVRIPAGAQINQMASLDIDTAGAGQGVPRGQQAGDELIAKPFQAIPDPVHPEWLLVTYEIDNAHFFYEYYTTAPAGSTNRSFTFTLFPTQNIETAQLEVQQPLTATQFQMTPPAISTHQDRETGFIYHLLGIGPVDADEPVLVNVAYVKLDADPSITRAVGIGGSEAAQAPLTGSYANPHFSTGMLLGFFLVGLGLVIGAALLLRWFSRTYSSRENEPAGRCCSACANQLQATDQFCPYCGLSVA